MVKSIKEVVKEVWEGTKTWVFFLRMSLKMVVGGMFAIVYITFAFVYMIFKTLFESVKDLFTKKKI